MRLVQGLLRLQGILLPKKFQGMHKFVAERYEIDPKKSERLHTNLMGCLLLEHRPSAGFLKDLEELGEYGEMLKGVLLGLKKFTIKYKDEKRRTRFKQELTSVADLKSCYDETIFPPVAWMLRRCDGADEAVTGYIKDVDHAINDYLAGRGTGQSDCDVLLAKVPLPKTLLALLRQGPAAGGASCAVVSEPAAIGSLAVHLFVYFMAIREAGLSPVDRILSRMIEKGCLSNFVSEFISGTIKHLKVLGVSQEMLIRKMRYQQRLFLKHKKPEKFLYPVFLNHFSLAYHALARPRKPEMTDDSDWLFCFVLYTVQLLHMLDRLNCDAPAGLTANNKPVTLNTKRDDLQCALNQFGEYLAFAENTIRLRRKSGDVRVG